MSDAIGRTLVRLYLTRRRLLEWTTAAQAKSAMSREITGAVPAHARRAGPGRRGRRRWWRWRGRTRWSVAAPFLVLWALSPVVARWVSRPPAPSPAPRPRPRTRGLLRSTARRTWRFFEAFVGPDDH